VCGSNDVTYFSPCHAGCQIESDNGSTEWNQKVFTSCSCIPTDISNLNSQATGRCQNGSCVRNLVLLGLMFIIAIAMTMAANVPRNHFSLRIVDPADRAISIAIGRAVHSCFE